MTNSFRVEAVFDSRQLLLVLALIALPMIGRGDAQCAGDHDGDGRVTVDEIVSVVSNALEGCSPFRWYHQCGPRIPGNQQCPSSVEFCTTEKPGARCGEPDAVCCFGSLCAGGQCNSSMVCTDQDPRPEGGCRLRSRRQFKQDIEYLAPGDLERLRAELLAMNLTRFRYKDEGPTAPPHLGFIIEDVEPSPCVDAENDSVDLYGYLSMAVATLQVQQRELEALRRDVEALRRAKAR